MKKQIICIALVASMIASWGFAAAPSTDLIAEQEAKMDAAHQMAEGARGLGYEEDCDIIKTAQEEWWKAYYAKKSYQEEAAANQKETEYPNAAYIWNYFKDLGYNDYVCAGLLGNMMREVGGGTLNIQYWLYGNGYYGICQWSKGYSSVWGTDLETQCNFLRDTIEYEMNTYGSNYYRGFNYDAFLNLQDASAAALAFSKCYERGASYTHAYAQTNAIIAYNYFTT
jgi:hypothetical protein